MLWLIGVYAIFPDQSHQFTEGVAKVIQACDEWNWLTGERLCVKRHTLLCVKRHTLLLQ